MGSCRCSRNRFAIPFCFVRTNSARAGERAKSGLSTASVSSDTGWPTAIASAARRIVKRKPFAASKVASPAGPLHRRAASASRSRRQPQRDLTSPKTWRSQVRPTAPPKHLPGGAIGPITYPRKNKNYGKKTRKQNRIKFVSLRLE
jgi:hypothetical protein